MVGNGGYNPDGSPRWIDDGLGRPLWAFGWPTAHWQPSEWVHPLYGRWHPVCGWVDPIGPQQRSSAMEHRFWVNVYPNGVGAATHRSKEAAAAAVEDFFGEPVAVVEIGLVLSDSWPPSVFVAQVVTGDGLDKKTHHGAPQGLGDASRLEWPNGTTIDPGFDPPPSVVERETAEKTRKAALREFLEPLAKRMALQLATYRSEPTPGWEPTEADPRDRARDLRDFEAAVAMHRKPRGYLLVGAELEIVNAALAAYLGE
jgi:hypothetical protein